MDNSGGLIIEKRLFEFVWQIIHSYEVAKNNYLGFIETDTVDIEEMITSLDNTRFLNKMYYLSRDMITQYDIHPASTDNKFLTKNEIVEYLNVLNSDIVQHLKNVQKEYNESFEIDDEEEYIRVQKELRDQRKKFKNYSEFCTSLINTVDGFIGINIRIITDDTSENNSPDREIEYYKTGEMVLDDNVEKEYDSEEQTNKEFMADNSASESPNEEKHQNVSVESDLTSEAHLSSTEDELSVEDDVLSSDHIDENSFLEWLVTDGNITENTARHYISALHSIEKLYQRSYGERENLIGDVSYDTIKLMISRLNDNSEYRDANERRHNEFSAALKKLIQFADIDSIEVYSADTDIDKESSEIEEENSVNSSDKNDIVFSPISDYIGEKGTQLKDYISENGISPEHYTRGDTEEPTADQSFIPNITTPFDLKDAFIQILSSNAPEIEVYREYKNGISTKILRELISKYFGRTITVFEISTTLMIDPSFKSVGKGYYILNEDVIRKDDVSSYQGNKTDKIPFVENGAFDIESDLDETAQISANDEFVYEVDESEDVATGAHDDVTIDTILDIIKQNSDNIQYKDGFGAYEIKNLLSRDGYPDISDNTIETMLSLCAELTEIDEGYYILSAQNDKDDVKEDDVSETPDLNLTETNEYYNDTDNIDDYDNENNTLYSSTDQSESQVSRRKDIVIRLNGELIIAYDYNDALNKVCEFAINIAPFRMARIAGQRIEYNGKSVFYRKAVPSNGYKRLSNGLQVMEINTLYDVRKITQMIKDYCQIDDDLIDIVSE